jgi:hypothetical protein
VNNYYCCLQALFQDIPINISFKFHK